MNKKNSIVITGIGAVSPIGIGATEFWDGLVERKSGVQIREELAATDCPLKMYSPVTGFDGKQWVRPRKALKVMCRPIQFGYTAAIMALEQAGLADAGLEPERLGTVFGSETFFADPMEVASVFRKCVTDQNYDHDRWGEFAMREIQPLWMLKYLPNMVTSHISIAADARGPSNSICQGEASGTLALIEGADLIVRGACDAVVVGGTGSQVALSGMLYRGVQSISKRIDQPAAAVRPFDRDRDGTVYGEGSGAIVLENAIHAKQRGAKVLATLSSWSRSFCPISPNGPAGNDSFQNAIAENIRTTMRRGDLETDEIAHVSAHGCAAKEADKHEANAIAETVGQVPVVANKSNYGELGPGGSALEMISSVMSLNEQLIPPTMNFETPDQDCPVNVNSTPKPCEKNAALKVSFSSTGQIACSAIRRQ